MSGDSITTLASVVALAGFIWALFTRLESRIERLESRFERLESRLNDVDARLARVDGRVDEQSALLRQLIAASLPPRAA